MIAGSLLLTACGYSPALQTGNAYGHNKGNGKATVMLMPSVTAGGFRTQATVYNYTKGSINHLVVKVFRLNGALEEVVLDDNGNQVSAELTNAELDNPVTFSNLFRRSIYRVKCYAYKAPGVDPANLISTQDAQSYTDIVVDDDDRPTVGNLKVRLIDVVFDGEGSTPAGVEVTDGGFVSSGPVSVTKSGQAPIPPTPNFSSFGTLNSEMILEPVTYDAATDQATVRFSPPGGSWLGTTFNVVFLRQDGTEMGRTTRMYSGEVQITADIMLNLPLGGYYAVVQDAGLNSYNYAIFSVNE